MSHILYAGFCCTNLTIFGAYFYRKFPKSCFAALVQMRVRFGQISMMCLVGANTLGWAKALFCERERVLESLETHICSFRCFGGSTAADEWRQKSGIFTNFWASDRNFCKKWNLGPIFLMASDQNYGFLHGMWLIPKWEGLVKPGLIGFSPQKSMCGHQAQQVTWVKKITFFRDFFLN